MADRELLRTIQTVREIAERLRITETELAALCGFSVPIAAAVYRRGYVPQQRRCLDGLRDFAKRARSVSTRAELGLPSGVPS